MRLTRAARTLEVVVLAGITLLGIVYFFERIRTVTIILIGTVYLFYIIYPAVIRLNRRLPLWASILIVYVVAIAIVASALAYFVPEIGTNIGQFVHDVPTLTRRIQTSPAVQRLPPALKDYIVGLPSTIAAALRTRAGEVAQNALHALVSIVTFSALFIVIPVVTIYVMIDTDRIRESVMRLFSPQSRPKVGKVLREINVVIEGYIRGQVAVAIIVGALIILLLTILHVPYATALGAFGGVLEIVPYAGAIFGGALAALVALIANGPLNAAFVVAGLVVINQFEGHVISPVVVGGSVKLRPLTIVLALLTGGELFGILGVLIAVPAAGIVKVLLENYAVKD